MKGKKKKEGKTRGPGRTLQATKWTAASRRVSDMLNRPTFSKNITVFAKKSGGGSPAGFLEVRRETQQQRAGAREGSS